MDADHAREEKNKRGHAKIHRETLAHFSCAACRKWWTIGDAPEERLVWFCPWCGVRQSTVPKTS